MERLTLFMRFYVPECGMTSRIILNTFTQAMYF